MAEHNNAVPGKGVIFINKYKTEGDSKPVMTGHLFVHRDLKAGERIEVAAWHHKTGGGMSLKCQDVRVPSANTAPQTPSGRPLPSDDIPF